MSVTSATNVFGGAEQPGSAVTVNLKASSLRRISNRRQERIGIKNQDSNHFSIDLSPPEPIQGIAPDFVQARYSKDLNIIKIHEAIRCGFGCILGNVKNMKLKIKDMKLKLKNPFLSYIEAEKLRF